MSELKEIEDEVNRLDRWLAEDDDANRRASRLCEMGLSSFCAAQCIEALMPEFADAARWRRIAMAMTDPGARERLVATMDGRFIVEECDNTGEFFAIGTWQDSHEAALLDWDAQQAQENRDG